MKPQRHGITWQLAVGVVLAVLTVGATVYFLRVHNAERPPALPAAAGLAQGAPAQNEAYKLIDGPYEVEEVAQLLLRDAPRGKNLPVRITYPSGDGPFPVIIFSHGAGGSKDCCTELTHHWASYGYVTLQPTHADSIRLRRQQGERGGMREAVGDAVRDPAAGANRARDVSFLIDSFAELGRRVPALKGKLDAKRIGMSGHSLGAYTAQLVAGAAVDAPGAKSARYTDERVRAFVLLSGKGRTRQELRDPSWDQLTRPMMSMTGSLDPGGGVHPEWKKEPFDFTPAGDKYHVFIEAANHMSFIGARAPLRSAASQDNAKTIFSYVLMATQAFWDAYLKSDAKAKAYLDSAALANYSDGGVTLYRK